ncbi:MAG: pilus assembly protein PilP [Candidatus Tectomicrobia bacterium]|uniref:Pilus assembly protein PilP n=1 Tax=Tectimicrobiota bacterium TaxID=2528274 RepID=A0A932FZT8_UNCTE|nr:pilus assembly protein PilP [Candidatus Tectomicrobia bacterium]
MPNRRSLSSFLLILWGVTFLFLFACGGEDSSTAVVAQPPVKKKEKGPVNGAAPPPAEKNGNAYVYDSQGRRDPFKSLLVGRKVEEEVEPVKIVTPLQLHDLGSLKLVGILWGEVGRMAIFETPDRKGYPIKVGAPVGRGNTQVKEITADKVVIVQRYKNIRGQVQTKEITLQLKKEEG